MLCSLDTSVMVLEPTILVDTISQDSVLCNGSLNGSACGIIEQTGYLWSTDRPGYGIQE